MESNTSAGGSRVKEDSINSAAHTIGATAWSLMVALRVAMGYTLKLSGVIVTTTGQALTHAGCAVERVGGWLL